MIEAHEDSQCHCCDTSCEGGEPLCGCSVLDCNKKNGVCIECCGHKKHTVKTKKGRVKQAKLVCWCCDAIGKKPAWSPTVELTCGCSPVACEQGGQVCVECCGCLDGD